jgi:hypothetical protein
MIPIDQGGGGIPCEKLKSQNRKPEIGKIE